MPLRKSFRGLLFSVNSMQSLLPQGRPALVLAPMQDVTNLAFIRVLSRRSKPDWFVTEYFRVHPESTLERTILRAIEGNDTGKPMFAQLIGQDTAHMIRTARELAKFPIAGIDLNLGCPAPVVCRKNAGGGLLRQLEKIDELLTALRDAIDTRLTVKTRIGYDSADEFPALLDLFTRHAIDGLTIHARTVQERYQTPVHPDCVRLAVQRMACPVIANGNIVDAATARAYQEQTGAHGLMVGRGAIRNPWIFQQLEAAWQSQPIPQPSHRDLLAYILDLYEESASACENFHPPSHVQAMKRTLAYISHGLAGTFEHDIRRATTPEDFFAICHRYLNHSDPLPACPPETSKLFCGFGDLLGGPSSAC